MLEILQSIGISDVLQLFTYLILIGAGIAFIIQNRAKIFNDKYSILIEMTKIGVNAAEQLGNSRKWSSEQKFNYVFNLVSEQLRRMGFRLTKVEIEALIEDAVFQLTGIKKNLKTILEEFLDGR